MAALGLFQDIGPWEVILILGIALLLFGAKRLPEIGRSLGKGLREFKGGVKGLGDDVKEGLTPDERPADAPPPPVKGSSEG